MVKLKTLLDSAQTAFPEDDEIEHEHVYYRLNFECSHSANLPESFGPPKSQRDIPLTGEEELHGDFFTLDYISHDDTYRLRDYDSRESMEAELVGDRGILNPFTTFVIAFVDSSVVDYKIKYTDSEGNRILSIMLSV